MMEFIKQQGGMVAFVIMVAIAMNFVLSGIAHALELVKDKTASDLDNKIYAIVNKICVVLQKVIDYGSGNREHK